MQDVSTYKSNNYLVSCRGSTYVKICQVNSENNKFRIVRNRMDYKPYQRASNRNGVLAGGTLIFKILRGAKTPKFYIVMERTIIVTTQNANLTVERIHYAASLPVSQ